MEFSVDGLSVDVGCGDGLLSRISHPTRQHYQGESAKARRFFGLFYVMCTQFVYLLQASNSTLP